jgi:hypothetical protein
MITFLPLISENKYQDYEDSGLREIINISEDNERDNFN